MSNIKISHSVMFHHFHGDGHPRTQGSINAAQLEAIIMWLRNNYNILAPQEYKNKVISNTIEQRDICLSFDDALLSQFDIALPILEKKNIKAFFFIYSAPILGEINYLEVFRYFRTTVYDDINDFYKNFFNNVSEVNKAKYLLEKKKFNEKKYLSSFPFYSFNDKWFRFLRDNFLTKISYENIMLEMIREKGFEINNIVKKLWIEEKELLYLKKNGHTIGLHSYSHPTMIHEMTEEEQFHEYKKNLQHLENKLGKGTIEAMSHPCGNYNKVTLSVLSKLGIRIGFLSNMGINSIKSPLEIPREDHANILLKMDNESYNI